MRSSLSPYNALPPEPTSTPELVDADDAKTQNDIKPTLEPAQSTSPREDAISWYWKNWKYESAACILVLSGPLVIFGTLYPYNGQPSPQWPFNASINSLLSVYALVLKASIAVILASCIGQLQWKWFAMESRSLYDMVRFDQATRDAGGALNLIWRQRFQQPLTALGCAITILAVAVDPFVQQLLRPVDCSIEVFEDGMSANLPVATYFGILGHFGASENSSSLPSKQSALQNALYAGTFAPQHDIPWQCPTGNCTFPEYSTIGLCNSCEDVSADVVVNFWSAPANPNAPESLQAFPDLRVHSSYNKNESIAMSVNMSVSLPWDVLDVNLAVTSVEQIPPYFEWEDDWRDKQLVFGFLLGATVAADGRVDWTTTDNSTCDSEAVDKSWSCRGYGAATCTIKPCIQVYNATVTAGTFKENLVTTLSGTSWGRIRGVDSNYTYYLAMVDSQCSQQERTDSSADSELKDRLKSFDFNIPDADIDLNAPPKELLSLVEDGCLHLVAPDYLLYTVGQYLQGTVQALPQKYSNSPDNFKILEMAHFEGPPVTQNIYNWGNTDFHRVESTLENITDSLTTYIRTHSWAQSSDGTNYTRTTQGRVYHYATCLEVKWPWLLFPSILSSLTILLFLLVIEMARKGNAPVWKASQLAWILRTDGPRVGHFSFSSDACEAMKDRSKQIAVHLDEMDGPRIEMVDMKDPHLDST